MAIAYMVEMSHALYAEEAVHELVGLGTWRHAGSTEGGRHPHDRANRNIADAVIHNMSIVSREPRAMRRTSDAKYGS